MFWVQAAVPDNPQEHSGHQESSRNPQWPGGHLRSHAGGTKQAKGVSVISTCPKCIGDTFIEHVTFNFVFSNVSHPPTLPGVSKSQGSHYFISSFVQWRCINFNLSIQTKSPTSNITGWKAHVRDPNFIFHTEFWLHYISVTEFQIVAPRDISHFALTQAALDEATEPWGIKVERVEM